MAAGTQGLRGPFDLVLDSSGEPLADSRRGRRRREIVPRPDSRTPDSLLDPIPDARDVDERLPDHAAYEQEGSCHIPSGEGGEAAGKALRGGADGARGVEGRGPGGGGWLW